MYMYANLHTHTYIAGCEDTMDLSFANVIHLYTYTYEYIDIHAYIHRRP